MELTFEGVPVLVLGEGRVLAGPVDAELRPGGRREEVERGAHRLPQLRVLDDDVAPIWKFVGSKLAPPFVRQL